MGELSLSDFINRIRYFKENNIKVLKITFYSDPTIGPHRAHGINAYKATVLHIHPLQILKIKIDEIMNLVILWISPKCIHGYPSRK